MIKNMKNMEKKKMPDHFVAVFSIKAVKFTTDNNNINRQMITKPEKRESVTSILDLSIQNENLYALLDRIKSHVNLIEE